MAGVRADGAEVVIVGPSRDERAGRARELAREQGLVLIPPYDDGRHRGPGHVRPGDRGAARGPGGGQEPGDRFTVLVPIGGGGLASGVATAVKSLRPDAQVFGVEPELAADARESLREGRIVRWEAEQVGRTAADGMRPASLGVRTSLTCRPT